jgi:ribosomal protein S18 acetylase RimI-like enzyme
MNADYTIRAATPQDATRLAVLGLQVWLHTYAWSGVSDPIANYVLREFTPANMLNLLQDADSLVLVAEADENLLAYTVLRFGVPHAGIAVDTEIKTLYVQAHFGRRGIGVALLNAARQATLRRTGNGASWLMVNAQNHNAQAFYAANGFAIEGETFFDLDGTRHKNWIMVWRGEAQT